MTKKSKARLSRQKLDARESVIAANGRGPGGKTFMNMMTYEALKAEGWDLPDMQYGPVEPEEMYEARHEAQKMELFRQSQAELKARHRADGGEL